MIADSWILRLSRRALALGMLVLAGLAGAAETVKDIRMWTAPDHTRIVLDLDGEAEYRLFRLSDPPRVVVDIEGVSGEPGTGDLELPDPVLRNVRTGVPEAGTFRVVMDIRPEANITPKTFQLEPRGPHGHRLVVDLNREGGTEKDRVAKVLEKSDHHEYLVAVDAGHGGEDPGAVGPGDMLEKDITLEVAKRLAQRINQRDDMRAFLTRKGDYFVKLRERVRMAREAHADLFISVHADGFKDPSARGASVFALSRDGATDEAAAYLARNENRADLAGGVDLKNVDKRVASVLLDLSQTRTITDSLKLGGAVLERLGGFARLHRDDVAQAPFMVLKSPDIPSILVETGFISNDTEARKLQRDAYQRKLARAVAKGSATFLEERNPVPAQVRNSGNGGPTGQATRYTVRKGDTLWSIAQQHSVSVQKLKQTNDVTANSLAVGRELEIP